MCPGTPSIEAGKKLGKFLIFLSLSPQVLTHFKNSKKLVNLQHPITNALLLRVLLTEPLLTTKPQGNILQTFLRLQQSRSPHTGATPLALSNQCTNLQTTPKPQTTETPLLIMKCLQLRRRTSAAQRNTQWPGMNARLTTPDPLTQRESQMEEV